MWLRVSHLSLFFLSLLLSLSASADELIVEPEMGRKPLLNAIQAAKHSIKLVMYGFTDETLLNAILQKKSAHKTVQVLLERTPYRAENENQKTIAELNAAHIDWQGAPPPLRFIHQKTLIIDGQKAIIMTFNFTHSTFKNERNIGLIIDDPKRVQAIDALFTADWQHQHTHLDTPWLIVSPDNSRKALLMAINQAKHTLQIYAQQISDYALVGALAKAARRGVTIEILTSIKIRKKQADFLTRAGVDLQQSKHYYIHAKVFIIDQRAAIIGSINLTRNSLEQNRELSVLTQDPNVVKQLRAVFKSDWQAEKSILPQRLQRIIADCKNNFCMRSIPKMLNYLARI